MNISSKKQSYELKADAYDHMRRATGFAVLSCALAIASQTDLVERAVQEQNLLAAAGVSIGILCINARRGNAGAAGLSGMFAAGLSWLAPHQEVVQQAVQEDNLLVAAGASMAAASLSGIAAAVRWNQGKVNFHETMEAIRAEREQASDFHQINGEEQPKPEN